MRGLLISSIVAFLLHGTIALATNCSVGPLWGSKLPVTEGTILYDIAKKDNKWVLTIIVDNGKGSSADWKVNDTTITCIDDSAFDVDGDGVRGCKDNCPFTANPDQEKTDPQALYGDAFNPVAEDSATHNGGCSLLAHARTQTGQGTLLCILVVLLAFTLARQFRVK